MRVVHVEWVKILMLNVEGEVCNAQRTAGLGSPIAWVAVSDQVRYMVCGGGGGRVTLARIICLRYNALVSLR